MRYVGVFSIFAVIGVSTSVTGTLQLPRTIVTMILPAAGIVRDPPHA